MENKLRELISDFGDKPRAMSVLDVGPGYKSYLKTEQINWICRDILEYDDDVIEWQNNSGVSNVYRIDLNSPSSFPEITSRYDLILLVEVLEHVEDPAQLLSWLFTLLSDNGIIVITVPTKYSELLMFRLNRNYNRNTLFPHVNFFAKSDLRQIPQFLGAKICYLSVINSSYLLFHTILHLFRLGHNVSDGKLRNNLTNILHDVIVNGSTKIWNSLGLRNAVLGRNYCLVLKNSIE